MKYIVIKQRLKNFVRQIVDAPVLGSLLRNAYRGWPNSQLELAKYYLFERKNFIEAYAWAEVACCRNLPMAFDIKQQAQANLKPEDIKGAWDLARLYKTNFVP